MISKKLLLLSPLLLFGLHPNNASATTDNDISKLKMDKEVIVAKITTTKTVSKLGLENYQGVMNKQNDEYKQKQERLRQEALKRQQEKERQDQLKKQLELERQAEAFAKEEKAAKEEQERQEQERQEQEKKQSETVKEAEATQTQQVTHPTETTTQMSIPSGSIQGIARQMMNQRGWGDDQWEALNFIVTHESGWNPNAKNPSSTAYGLFQMLTESSSDPTIQISNGLNYIAGRYGTPNGAYAFWISHNWY